MKSTRKRLPTTLLEAVRHFSDLDVATEFVARLRWPDGFECPACRAKEYSYLTTRRLWKCKACKKQTSVKVGTIFEDSPLGLDKWLPAMWLLVNCKNGISSHELGRALGVHQESAWFMLHRIRLAMQSKTFAKLSGEVEADETYVGGIAGNMHKKRRTREVQGKPVANKTPVLALVQREPREVVAQALPAPTGSAIHPIVRKNVETGSSLYTDSHKSYGGLKWDYEHSIIDHAVGYVQGRVSTNSAENFFSCLKRCLHGTYIAVQPKHLGRYVDEQVYRFNARTLDDLGRLAEVLGNVPGRRLTYRELTAKAS